MLFFALEKYIAPNSLICCNNWPFSVKHECIKEWQAWWKGQGWEATTQEKTRNFSKNSKEVDTRVCPLKSSYQAVSGCSLCKLCDAWLWDACLEETLAAFLCECQLLLCCTSQRSLHDWCEPVLCPARALWFLFWLQRKSNQSAVKTWPTVKHRKASFVSLQINHKGLTFSGFKLHMRSYILADSCHKHELVPNVQANTNFIMLQLITSVGGSALQK